jgi:hypothetical protein
MTKFHVVAAICLSATTAIAQQQSRIEIKGVPLGLDVSAYEAVFPPPGLKCYENTCYKQSGSNLFYGDAAVTAAKADLIEGKVESIELVIWEGKFAGVAAALAEKFGKPTQDIDAPVQNRLGNTFPNRRITWNLPDGTIVAQQRSGDVESSSITLSSAKYLKALGAKATSKPKEDAKRL